MTSLTQKSQRDKLKSELEKECAFLSQAVVKKRAGGRCEVTGIKGETESHHVFRKGTYPILRYNPDNQVALSNKGHYEFHAKGENALKAFLIKKRGAVWMNNLIELKRDSQFQWTVENLKETKDKLERELNEN